MIDSHAHLTLDPILSNLDQHLNDFKSLGGTNILNVSSNLETVNLVVSQSIKYENKYPKMIQTGIGIHPEEIKSNKNEIDKHITELKSILNLHQKRIVCIGETGLDYYQLQFQNLDTLTLETIIENQKYNFRKHIELALEYNLPLSIHTRDKQNEYRCINDTLSIISNIGKGKIRGIFHSYTQSKEYIKDIINLNFKIGFNGIITYPKAENVREILINTNLENILLETDCPLLPPQMVRNGKRTKYKYGKPEDILEIAETVSKVKNISLEKLFDITKTNYQEIIN